MEGDGEAEADFVGDGLADAEADASAARWDSAASRAAPWNGRGGWPGATGPGAPSGLSLIHISEPTRPY